MSMNAIPAAKEMTEEAREYSLAIQYSGRLLAYVSNRGMGKPERAAGGGV